jgi:putative transposase
VNPQRYTEQDYIRFLIASYRMCTCTEAARCIPESRIQAAHDSVNRFLERQSSDTEALWQESLPMIEKDQGFLIIDDTTLDKPYSNQIDLVSYHWSGKHHRVVKGISLVTLLWTDGTSIIPVDFRVYDREHDKKTKNDHFQEMLDKAKERELKPHCVLFDSWYSSMGNLKLIRKMNWHFLTRLKSNRQVKHGLSFYKAVSEVDVPEEGCEVHLRGYGQIKLFKVSHIEKEPEFWATDLISMNPERHEELKKISWRIEEFHRGVKQFCGIERCQARKTKSQCSHILLSIRSFLVFEKARLQTGRSWHESKMSIHRSSIAQFIENPSFF